MQRLLSTALLGYCLLLPDLVSQNITVRAIEAKTAEPLKGKIIRMEVFDGPPVRRRLGYLEAKTGPDGVAVFGVRGPVPLTINVALKGGHWIQCSPFTYKGEDVLRSGAVIENECGKLPKINHRFSAKPGEIVIFARHWTFLNPEVSYPM